MKAPPLPDLQVWMVGAITGAEADVLLNLHVLAFLALKVPVSLLAPEAVALLRRLRLVE